MKNALRSLSALLATVIICVMSTLTCVRSAYASDSWNEEGSFYIAHINYVDIEGNRLGLMDSVLVDRCYLYMPPTQICIRTDSGVREYVFAENGNLNAEGLLALDPNQGEGGMDYQVIYQPVEDDDERAWTVVLEDGSVDPSDPHRVIQSTTYYGRPGEHVTHETAQQIVVDGKGYVPTSAALESYEHDFAAGSMDIAQTIYYVPDDWPQPEAYEVTVNYVSIATNEVIDSQTYTVFPTMQQGLEINTPETFSRDDIEWVRLDGQEAPFRHDFYDGRCTYAVYYRDVNDDLNAQTVAKRVNAAFISEEGNAAIRFITVVGNGADTTYVGKLVDVNGEADTADDGTSADAPGAGNTTADHDDTDTATSTTASSGTMGTVQDNRSSTQGTVDTAQTTVTQMHAGSERLPATGDEAPCLPVVVLLVLSVGILSLLSRYSRTSRKVGIGEQ